jgi:hypothetical protein
VKTYKITTYREEELPKLFSYVVGNTQRKLDAIKIGNNIPSVSAQVIDSNIMRKMVNHENIPNVNIGSSTTAVRNVNLDQIMNKDNIIANNANMNQIGKNPTGWLPQSVGMANQSGFNRGAVPVPRNTITSNNDEFNNK